MQDNGFNTLMKPLFKKHCVAMYWVHYTPWERIPEVLYKVLFLFLLSKGNLTEIHLAERSQWK